ncbi:MAG: hypothetical protein ACPGWR_11400 [Ardenticatenaceae bacterium]
MLNLQAGAKPGEPPTPETIRLGTVRMEAHPDYKAVIESAKDVGFEIKYTEDDPYVKMIEVCDTAGNLIQVEKELGLQKGMRYIDLEHELGHIEQLLRFGEPGLATDRLIEHANGRRVESRNKKGIMTPWQYSILEYHNRLNEFLRLYERGVDVSVLKEHAAGVDKWREIYFNKGLGGHNYGRGGRPNSKQRARRAWATKYFGEMSQLVTKYRAALDNIKI